MWNDKIFKLFVAICIFCIIGHTFWDKFVLNFPYKIWIVYPIFLLLILLIDSSKFKTKLSFRSVVISIFGVIIFFFAFIQLPLSATIFYGNKKDNCQTYKCEIVGLGTSSKDRSITYNFKDHNYKFSNYQPYRGFSKTLKELDEYYVELVACKGMFDSYIRESLILRKK